MFSIPFAAIVMLAITLSSCSGDDGNKNSSSNNSDSQNSSTCIKCNEFEVGETFELDGVTYTVADRKMLDEALEKGEDLTKYCTSKVTNMDYLFYNAESFNQDIGNWDVSKVTDMSSMFEGATSFNQDLTQWCVYDDSEPSEFSKNSALTPENHPVWGTCPE